MAEMPITGFASVTQSAKSWCGCGDRAYPGGNLAKRRRHDRTGHRIQPRTQSSQAAGSCGYRRSGRGGGASHRNRRRSDPAQLTPITRSGGGTSGRRTASAVRRGCIVGDGGVLAHAAIRSQCACRAWAYQWRVGARGPGQGDQLHRCKIRPSCLRLSCEDRSIAGRLRLSIRGVPRWRRAGVRHFPDLPTGSCAVYLHQLR